MLKALKTAGLAAALVVSGAVSAGTITEFSNRTQFDAAVGATTLEDFTESFHFPIPGGSLSSASSFGSLHAGEIEPGAVYTTPVGTGNYFNIDGGGGFVGGFLDGFEPSTRDLTISYTPLVSAFGFDTNQLMPNFDVTINFASGTSFHRNYNAGYGMTFFGFRSSAVDIKSVVISGNNSYFGFAIDNHAFGGAAAPVPEPETYAMMVVGLGLLGLVARRRNQEAA